MGVVRWAPQPGCALAGAAKLSRKEETMDRNLNPGLLASGARVGPAEVWQNLAAEDCRKEVPAQEANKINIV